MVAAVFYKVLLLSLSGTMLFFLLMAVKPIAKKLFSPNWNYYFLLIIIITFLVPYGMVMPKPQKALVDVQTFIEEKNPMESNKKEKIIKNTVMENKDKVDGSLPINSAKENKGDNLPRTKTEQPLDFSYVKERAWIIWVLGSTLFITVQLASVVRFKRKLKATSSAVESQEVKDIFYHCCDQLGIHKNISLKVCKEIGTPMATGIFMPVITIPTEEFDVNTLRMIFTHELMHYKRKDLWIKVMSFGASALHWFNPVIYMVNKELNKNCELSCDWQIIKDMNPAEKQYYGLAILTAIDNSINRKMALGTGMAASSKKHLKERLFMIKDGKNPKKSITLFAVTIAMILPIAVGFVTNGIGETKKSKSTTDFAVMSKEDGLWAVNLSKPGKEVIIDQGSGFKNLSISPNGKNVAYTKDSSLYIAPVDLIQGKREVIKVSEKVVSYGWANCSDLAYSTEKGGLNGFNLKSKESSTYIESEERYEGLVGDGKGTVYGEVYRSYTQNGQLYSKDKGVISYEVAPGKEKVIVPSKPSNEEVKDITDLGLMPKVAGVSKDGAYVYIWCKVHAGSANADGVPFGVYEVKNNKFTAFNKEKILALAYSDNLAINPLDGRFPVLNNGGDRFMNINKTLGQVDVLSGTFTPILPENMIASDGPYGGIAKGMATMTPAFSPDGKKVIFSAWKAAAIENLQQWQKEHNIYTVDLKTKKVEKITKDHSFDFAPAYISKGKGIVFARRMDGKDLSLWTVEGNKEECIAKGIKLDKNSGYYGHYELKNCLAFYISEE